MKRTSNLWTKEEDDILRQHANLNARTIHNTVLPERTVVSIQTRFATLHLKGKKLLTPAQIKAAYEPWGGERAYKR